VRSFVMAARKALASGLMFVLAACLATDSGFARPAANGRHGDTNLTDWQNCRQLVAGQEIEVTTSNGRSVQGAFIGFGDQSISLHRKQNDITIPRTEVSRVQLHPAKRGRYTWIGAALGAGAGAGVGAGIGEQVANESGGDFRNLKPAIIGVSAGIGALVGALIGSVIGSRRTTIYIVR
jgi:hypothetical protein